MARHRRSFGYLRKLPSGKYQASYIGTDQRRHCSPTTFTAKIDAEGWLAAESRMLERQQWEPPGERADRKQRERRAESETISTYASKWLAEGVSSGRLRPLTQLDYRRSLDLHILPTLGDLPLAELTRSAVRTWNDSTLADTPPRARSKAYALLRALMNSAVQDDLTAVSPVHLRGAGVARRKHELEPASIEELVVIVAAMPDRLKLIVQLAAWCALRYGELAGLRRNDVNLRTRQLRITRSVSYLPGETVVGPPKTKAGTRRVAIPPHLMPAVQEHLTQHVLPGQDALLFAGDAGGFLHESVMHRHWSRARKKAGRPDLHFHDLRHTGATLAAQAGATTAELQARLGHATPDAAMIYQHAARQRDEQLAIALSRMATGDSTK